MAVFALFIIFLMNDAHYVSGAKKGCAHYGHVCFGGKRPSILYTEVAILQLVFHDVTTVTPAREPQSFSALFSIVKVSVLVLINCACARRLRALLEIPVADDSTTASLTVRYPQRYLFLFFFMETRGESETYKKDTEQTRTIQQIHKDLTYHNFAELDSFSPHLHVVCCCGCSIGSISFNDIGGSGRTERTISPSCEGTSLTSGRFNRETFVFHRHGMILR
ncbi:hypothetical protein TNCV_1816651 [Trichonephila clavipes]|nr:hypothetical protein TNCV_1816651 [Trichonephila clavipes]